MALTYPPPRALQEPTADALLAQLRLQAHEYTSTYNPLLPHTQQALLVIMLGLTGNRHNCPAPLDV